MNQRRALPNIRMAHYTLPKGIHAMVDMIFEPFGWYVIDEPCHWIPVMVWIKGSTNEVLNMNMNMSCHLDVGRYG